MVKIRTRPGDVFTAAHAPKSAHGSASARAQLPPKGLPPSARSFDVRLYARWAVIDQRKSGVFPAAPHLREDDAASRALGVNAVLHQAALRTLHPPVYRLANGPAAARARTRPFDMDIAPCTPSNFGSSAVSLDA
ncbi:MAG TPA: hypothetical protein VFU28_10785 [Vicinamibacterales bacterium]|nr:hypothetical protein [Vicinamibacterales bacterium]